MRLQISAMLLEPIKNLNTDTLVGVEIGCCMGGTTRFLLENLPNLQLYGVDPYEVYIDWNGNSFGYEGLMHGLIENIPQWISAIIQTQNTFS